MIYDLTWIQIIWSISGIVSIVFYTIPMGIAIFRRVYGYYPIPKTWWPFVPKVTKKCINWLFYDNGDELITNNNGLVADILFITFVISIASIGLMGPVICVLLKFVNFIGKKFLITKEEKVQDALGTLEDMK